MIDPSTKREGQMNSLFNGLMEVVMEGWELKNRGSLGRPSDKTTTTNKFCGLGKKGTCVIY